MRIVFVVAGLARTTFTIGRAVGALDVVLDGILRRK
jgi:hypothetical protein